MTDYYVCVSSGQDNNIGSNENPLKTINKAIQRAKPGDSILVKSGIYRERIVPIKSGLKNEPITIKSIEKHGAIVRGSHPWKYKSIENGIMVGSIDELIFNDKSHFDGKNPFKIPLCVTPYGREGFPETKIKSVKNSDASMVYVLGQVFADDEMYLQCPYKSEMESTKKSWFYDGSENKLYINGANENQNIEITNQRRLLAPYKRNLKNIIVDGFIFERCGNQYPNKFWSKRSNQQAGAVGTRCGKFWIIQNNIIRFANGIGIDWGNEGGSKQDLELGKNGLAKGSYGNKIINNIICDNGAAGTAAFMANKFEFTKNLVERNNNLHFAGKQRWESAGVKIHKPKNSIIGDNIVRNNYCHGIWSDQGSGINSLYCRNIIVDNKRSGIEFEIGTNTTGRVVNNIFDNNEYGVHFATSGGVLIAHNIFIKSKKYDISTVFFKRGDKWDSLNLEVYYNLFLYSPQYYQLSPNSSEPKASRSFGNNVYINGKKNQYQVKYNWKKKPFMGFDKWCDFFDEKSVLIKPYEVSLIYDNEAYYLKLQTNELPKFSTNDKMGLTRDYHNEKWQNECLAGPFENMIIGENVYNL